MSIIVSVYNVYYRIDLYFRLDFMELQYYVLWKKNNPMLQEYLDLYYDTLCNILSELSESGCMNESITKLLEHPNHRKFILHADISSTIHILHDAVVKKASIPWPQELYSDRLTKQIDLFLQGKESDLIYNQWEKIGDTEIRLTTEDYNPYSADSSHPDHEGSGAGVWWWNRPEAEWLQVYTKTFELLKRIDEGVYDELNQIIGKIMPFGTSEGLHNSCSHKDCIGHLYMWYTTDTDTPEFNIVEAVIHESSHNKLNLIMQQHDLILNDMTEKYYSAYRPDARHIKGTYLWLHAFAPVIYILMTAYEKGLMWESRSWLWKIVLYYLKNKITYKVLVKHGKFTPLWQDILDEIKYVLDLTDKAFTSINCPKEVIMEARDMQKSHFLEVNKNYPHLEY